MQAQLRELSGEMISSASLREWQRYRGWTLKILEDLEHSGGKTTREIATAIGYPCHSASVTLCRMLNVGLVEKVERWGWRITRDGIVLLSINYVNRTSTQHQQNVNTTSTEEKEEPAPSCFHAPTCHIKRLCSDKRYIPKNAYQCDGCIWRKKEGWKLPSFPVETKRMGGTGASPELEELCK